MEVEQITSRLQIKVIGIQWVILTSFVSLILIVLGVSFLTSNNWIERFWGACFLLAGSVALLTTLLTTPLWVICTFDKTLGVVRFEYKTVLFPKVIKWRLQDIQSIQVDTEEDSDSATHYVINLLSMSGQRLQLREITNSTDPQEFEAIAQRICQFIGLLS